MSAPHVLRLRVSPYGGIDWTWTCDHEHDDPRWVYRLQDGSIDPNNVGDCWLESWWDNAGVDLFGCTEEPLMELTKLPIAVKPCKCWTYDNGGHLVLDEGN